MKNYETFLSFDLGATSGRCVVGFLEDGQLRVAELRRFSNGRVLIFNGHYIDVLRFYTEIKKRFDVLSEKI
jgi:rhamnulokinase